MNNLHTAIISATDINIDTIIHIADIHIRLSSFHNEYNLVFQKFYDNLNKLKLSNPNTIVCLCGDILHSKDELKPDTVIQTWNFLKNVADIFPLIIIVGNHDTIEQNGDKIDSIRAILKDRPIKNIHYLIKSGIYLYNNIIFSVSSIIDHKIVNINNCNKLLKQFNEHIKKFKKNQIKKIALYHGQVGNTVNNVGVRLKGDKTLDDFGKYDFILLGDVHKFQYLNDNKTVAYASSMISQNFSETDTSHGYIQWDLTNKTSEYIILPNDYAYHVIKVEEINDDLSNIIYDAGYLRIECKENCDRQLIINKFKEKKPNIIISWKTNFTNVELNKQINEVNDNNDDVLVRTNQMNELIIKYLKCKMKIDDDEKIKVVMTKLKETIDSISTKGKTEYVKSNWKILWLSFDHMYGYGADNIIDFTKYPNNEVIGIFGDNAVGKSSIIDIITFMLFSQSARDESSTAPKDIININHNKANGMIVIESCNTKYLIKRQCSRDNKKNGTFQIRQTMELYKLIAEKGRTNFKLFNVQYKLVSLTEKDRFDTVKILTNIIGTYENFISTSILLQGNNKTFKLMSNKEKKDFLCQILNIAHFTEADEIIKTKYKEIKQQLLIICKSIDNLSQKSIINIEEENNKLSDECSNLKKTLDQNIGTRCKLIDNISILSTKLIHLDIVNETDYKNATNKINILSNEIKLIESNNENIKNKINSINNETNKNLNDINNLITEKTNEKMCYKLSDIDTKYTLSNQQYVLKQLTEKQKKLISVESIDNEIIKYRQLISTLNKLHEKNEIIVKNNQYQLDHKINQQNICDEINKLNNSKLEYVPRLVKIDINEDDLIKKINELDQYMNNSRTIKYLANRNKICDEYDKLVKNNKETIYKLINELRLNKDDVILNQLKVAINISFGDNTLVKKYKIIENFMKNYNINHDLLEKFNEQRENIVSNKIINNEIEHINQQILNQNNKLNSLLETSINIEEFNILQDQIQRESEYKSKILDLSLKMEKCKSEENMLVNLINNVKNRIDILTKNDINSHKVNKLDVELNDLTTLREHKLLLSTLNSDVDKNLYLIENKKSEINIFQQLLLQHDKNLATIEQNKNIVKEINNTKNILNNMNLQIDVTNKHIVESETKMNTNTLLLNQIKFLEEKKKKIENEFDIYAILNMLTGSDGLQLYLLNEYLDKISNKINTILNQFIDKTISFKLINDKTIDINIISNGKLIHTLSGMESFMLDLTFRIIISEISLIPKSSIMFIDESISVLDKNRLASIDDLFSFLRQYYEQVYLITHMKQVKNFINNYIDIEKVNGFSIIKINK